MKTFISLYGASAVCAAAFASFAPSTVAVAADRPVVVELYTHASCPETSKVAGQIESVLERPDVVGLVMPVALWSGFGGRSEDAAATDAFRERQRAFARALRVWPVATPQVVIDGVAIGNPSRLDAIEAAIDARHAQGVDAVSVTVARSGAAAQIEITGAPETAEVWLAVLAAAREGDVGPAAAKMVSRLEPLGPASDYAAGAEVRALAPADARAVILVQDGPGGPILASAVLEPVAATLATLAPS